ncbi:PRD domain-containing protein [Clostridium perfringens]
MKGIGFRFVKILSIIPENTNIETLYPKEFEAATKMVKKLEDFTGVSIVDDEFIGFLL